MQTKWSLTQTAMEQLLSENAKLQVHITTLQSQSNSLTAQHTALQLANSQLVAEKEEVFIFRSIQFFYIIFILISCIVLVICIFMQILFVHMIIAYI